MTEYGCDRNENVNIDESNDWRKQNKKLIYKE